MAATIRKRMNMLEISPAIRYLHFLAPALTFQRIKPLIGQAAVKARRHAIKQETYLYKLDEEGDRLYTFAGLLTRLVELFRSYNIDVKVEEMDPPFPFEPLYEKLKGVQLRESQEDMLAVLLSCDRAQLDGLTGMGKSFLICQLAKLFPYPDCHIVVCAQQRPIVKSLHRELAQQFPGEVGMVGNGSNDPRRITVATAKSLRKCKIEKTRLMFYDEVHTAAADQVSKDLLLFANCHMYGFSASTECRSDRADLLTEALFGPVRIRIPYQRGVEEGIVPVIDTRFYRLPLTEFRHKNSLVRRYRQVISNPVWNNAVARVARYWETQYEDPQILILTDKLEHVINIGNLLPGYEWVYASADKDQIKKFKKKGILPQDWKPCTPKAMEGRIRAFESGALRRVVATTTLGTGVDMRHLDVVIRADGGRSEIANIQFRGRVTRGDHGTYCDFVIEGDETERDRSLERMRSCRRAGWNVKEEDLPFESGR